MDLILPIMIYLVNAFLQCKALQAKLNESISKTDVSSYYGIDIMTQTQSQPTIYNKK